MHDEVIAAMARQPMNLADPRVAQVIAACESGIKRLLKTERAEVFFYSANGHGGWEAIIANLVGPGCLAGAAMSVQGIAVGADGLRLRLRRWWRE